MKRWLGMILMIAAVAASLTVGAAAAANIGDRVELENHVVLEKLTTDGWTVIDGKDCSGIVVIPATYEGEKVVAIGAYKDGNPNNMDQSNAEVAFKDNKKMTGVVIPDTVTTIGPWAFAGAENLRNLTIPRQVKTIANNAFQQCHGLTTVTFENGDAKAPNAGGDELTIGYQAFYWCENLATLDFPQHTTHIKQEAFMTCKNLREIFVWKGDIEQNAFKGYDRGVLTRVAINNKANGVTTVNSLAFGEVPAPIVDPENPGADPYPKLPVIHFSGTQVTLGATNNLWPDDKIHTGIDMEKAVTNPNCLEPGITNEWIECDQYDCTFYESAGRVYDKSRPAALGHNFVEPTAAEYEELLKDEMREKGYKDCEKFEWTYDKNCSRCTETEPVTETVEEKYAEHDWDPDLTKVVEDVPSTCEENNHGHKTTDEHCKVCEQPKRVTEEYDLVNPGTHTYYKGNKITVTEVEPTCKYYGIEVTYLMCDGNHTENSAGLKPCEFPGANGKTRCGELLTAIDDAIEALEEAAENYAPVAGGGTAPAVGPLAAERDALLAAVDAYRTHVLEDHKPIGNKKVDPETNKECIVSVKTDLDAEGDGHPEGAIIPLSESVRTAPDGVSPYNCAEGGIIKTLSFCPYCGEVFEHIEEIAPVKHRVPKDKQKPIGATCTEPGKIEYLEGAKCEECGAELEGSIEIDPTSAPLGHEWDNFVADPGQDAEQAEDCTEKTVTGTATCKRCGKVSDAMTITIPGKTGHTWGDWVVTKAPTETETGTETRTCKVCGKTEERTVPATGPKPDVPDDPNKPDDPNDPGTTDPKDETYTITVVSGVGGTATASRTTAKYGDSITVTVTVDSGYELDMIRVVGSTTAEDLGSRRTFTMPASNVEIRVSFERIADAAGWGGVTNGNSKSEPHTQPVVPQQITSPGVPQAVTEEQTFQDIPVTHWASGEIAWVNEMGYMSGTNGRFRPDTDARNQDLWMIMAKLMGATPVNQTEANRWAIINGFTSAVDPMGTFNRSQLATALYRCAGLKGRDTRNKFTLAGIADSALVPQTSRAAMIWAVSQGIIAADEASRIQPTKTVTRAELAVFVYRFCQKV